VTSSLLATKLHAPRRRRNIVARSRLTDALQRGDDARLTLVSAPAGFGKTTALTEWLAVEEAAGTRVAWLSLDEHDNDPARYWSYVLAALRTAMPGVGADAASLLDTQAPITSVLTSLLNDFVASDSQTVLVLDDYHVIESPETRDGMAFLVEHVPPQLRLVIASRADPALPLPRLRARGELVEVRAADLRFARAEAAAYLEGMVGHDLDARDIDALETRTEGWIAALQLAALSMQGRDDISTFVAGFAGDDRFVVEYLAGEVLHRQPESIRTFLLHTCILDRLSASLCDAVTGSGDSAATLQALDESNLFLVPLDDRRGWYRYHHLFADVLRLRLLREDPADVRELHARAGRWFEQHDETPEAIWHTLAGQDFDRAADLIERAIPAMRRARQERTLRNWFDALPAEVFLGRPALALGYAGALLQSGDAARVANLVQAADDALASETPPTVIDPEELPRLPAEVAIYRAGLARLADDVDGTMFHARRALALAPAEDHFTRGAAAALLALAQWSNGDLAAAESSWIDGRGSLAKAGHHADTTSGDLAIGELQLAQGRRNDAKATYEQGLVVARRHDVVRATADLHVALSEVFLQQHDLDAARSHLATSVELGDVAGSAQFPYRRRVAEALLRAAEDDLSRALELLDEAEQVYAGDFFPNVRPIAAVRARVLIDAGDLAGAQRWAREQHLSSDDELTYLREYEHVTLARLLRAEGKTDEADELLDRLAAAAEAGGHAQTLTEIAELRGSRVGARPASQPGLVDPLSDRELDVLRLLRSDLSGPDIARELMVSLNTMRTHTKNIYTKLGVNNRREAVRRAAELGL
jgi:LuxR family maltose regulon positive regulatory protein